MENRLARVRDELRRKNQDALLLSSVPNITYLTNFSNFSKDEREAFLLITKKGQFLFTDGRHIEAVQNQAKGFEIVEITTNRPLMKRVRDMLKRKRIKHIAIEEKNLTVDEKEQLFFHYNDTYHYSDTLQSLRLVKEREELQCIERACRLGDEAFQFVLTKIKRGVSEKELACEIEYFIKRQGADISFPPIVAFGANSSVPHHQTNDQKLKTNDIVLLDFGVKVDNYCSDMTRTVFFGKASSEQKGMYRTVLEAQQYAIDFLTKKRHSKTHRHSGKRSQVPDGTWRSASRISMGSWTSQDDIQIQAFAVDQVARRHIESKGYPTIPHSLGHGIGLEVHEEPSLSPRSKDVLKAGMVFSIEPGIYIPGFGGVRIEDLVVLEKDDVRLLTKSPKDLIEL